MSISNKRNYKTFTKGPPASLLHCIENILNHFSGKCFDYLTMAALSFISQLTFVQYSGFLPQFIKIIPIPLLAFDLVEALGTAKVFVNLITK